MKRLINLFLSLIIILTLTSCNILTKIDEYNSKKKYINEYTSLLLRDEDFKLNFNAQMISDDTYILKDFSPQDRDNIRGFFLNLRQKDFKKKFKHDSTFKYKIVITTKNNKYIIDMFDDETCILYTFNGKKEPDIISLSSSPKLYNLYELCSFLNNQN